MREITHCPNCQTQFFVNDAQLNQHGGLVRCGQCLHVFNAKEQFVAHAAQNNADEAKPSDINQPDTDNQGFSAQTLDKHDQDKKDQGPEGLGIEGQNIVGLDTQAESTSDIIQPDAVALNTALTATESITTVAPPTAVESDTYVQSSWPTLDHNLIDDAVHAANAPTQSTQDTAPAHTAKQLEPARSIEADGQNKAQASAEHSTSTATFNTNTQAAHDISPSAIASNHSHHVNDLAVHAKLEGKKSTKRHRWLWAVSACLLLCLAIAQSIYFLRNSIAMYYPDLKPYLIWACQQLQCSIELPKQIDWIIIDDSDMQEDPDHAGVMRLSSMLYNKAGFIQAYPNLELTLTDTDDNAVLRRIFTPAEYLPADTDISNGFKAGAEIRVKLAITAQEVSVAGYRLYVTY